MWNYSDEVMDHFMNPRNVGMVDDPDGVGEVGSLACGDALTLMFKLDENERIVDVKFQTFGCASAIASSSALTEMVKGKTLDEASQLTRDQVAEALGRPNLFFGVAAGNMDSMINRYTADRKVRNDDAYTPGGAGGARPDRSVLIYANRCRQAFKGVGIVIGGIEASLRRLQTDAIDIYFIHWPDPKMPFEETARLMQSLKDQGKVRAIGVRPNGVNINREVGSTHPQRLQQAVLNQCPNNQLFLAHMAANALSHRPPLGFFRTFVLVHDGKHDDTFDIKHRGIVPITDLQAFLGDKPIVTNRRSRVLVISRGDVTTGLLVGDVQGMRHFAEEQSITAARIEGVIGRFVQGAFENEDGIWPVLSMDQLVNDEQFRMAAA